MPYGGMNMIRSVYGAVLLVGLTEAYSESRQGSESADVT